MRETALSTEWIGHEMFDADGKKIGTIEDVRYGDVALGLTWLIVKAHPLDKKCIFIPAGEVRHAGERVIVALPKECLDRAPREREDDFLSPKEEREILSSYGLEYVPATMESDEGSRRASGPSTGYGDALARVLRRIGASWWAALMFGLATLAVGVVALVYPSITIGVVGVLFGLQLLLAGLVCLTLVFVGGERHRILSALLGILALIVGVLCLRNVTQSVVILTLAIGIYWLIHGILLTISGLSDVVPWGAGWAILTGFLSFVAGVIALCYPVGSAYALAVILGIWLVVFGILRIVNSLQLRKAFKNAL